jgi:hypothetical protein
MGRPGRKRRLALEDEYWKLIGDVVGTVEACRRLGIGRTTGYYWRAHRGGLVRTTLPKDTRSGRYLSLLERERIGVLTRRGWGAGDRGEVEPAPPPDPEVVIVAEFADADAWRAYIEALAHVASSPST